MNVEIMKDENVRMPLVDGNLSDIHADSDPMIILHCTHVMSGQQPQNHPGRWLAVC